MKLIIFLIIFATFCKLNFSFSVRNDFSSFQNYRNMLAYILNQTKTIDGLILDGVENLVGYAEEPDDYIRAIGDHLIKSLYNEPQVPYFDEFGAEFYELSCQEIEEELQILFEVSNYFVSKAVRNEETIEMLKILVSDLAKIGYDNYDFISNVIDTIADNYAAQNHVFMMIEDLDDEIELEIETIAKYCRKGDYKDVEEPEVINEDGLLDILMDNGQDLLEFIGFKADDDLELEETPELLVFEANVEPEQLMIENFEVNQEEAAIENPEFHIFGGDEELEDQNLNSTAENVGPIVINLVMEPESPQNDDKLQENQAQNTETEEVLNFLAENPEVVKLFLQNLETEISEDKNEESNLENDVEIEKLGEKNLEAENLIFSNFENEVPFKEIIAENMNADYLNEKNEIEAENIGAETFDSDDINVKGIVINVPYPEEEINENFSKNDKKLERDEMDKKELEDLKNIFPLVDEKIDQIEDTVSENSEKESENEKKLMTNPEKDEILNLLNPKIEEDSEFELDYLEIDEFELDVAKLDDEYKFIDKSNKKETPKNTKIQDKVVERILQAAEKDKKNSEYSDDEEAAELQNKEEPQNTKEFIDIEAKILNEASENSQNKNSNFEKFLKIPETFWQIPFGFWQSFQNFWENDSKASSEAENLTNFEQNSNVYPQNSRKVVQDSPQNNPKNSKINEETAKKLDEEILNFEMLNGEILTGNDEIFQPETDESDEDEQENEMIKEKFGFEEGIEGVDDEIVLKIMENQEKSAKIDGKNSKTKKNFEQEAKKDFEIGNKNQNNRNVKNLTEQEELEVKNPELLVTDLDLKNEIKPETFDDESPEDFMTIDGQIEDSELKEDDFVPQFSEDDSDIVDDDRNNLEDFGNEILKIFGVTENQDNKIQSQNTAESDTDNVNKVKEPINAQKISANKEIENLELQIQLLKELIDEKRDTNENLLVENIEIQDDDKKSENYHKKSNQEENKKFQKIEHDSNEETDILDLENTDEDEFEGERFDKEVKQDAQTDSKRLKDDLVFGDDKNDFENSKKQKEDFKITNLNEEVNLKSHDEENSKILKSMNDYDPEETLKEADFEVNKLKERQENKKQQEIEEMMKLMEEENETDE